MNFCKFKNVLMFVISGTIFWSASIALVQSELLLAVSEGSSGGGDVAQAIAVHS